MNSANAGAEALKKQILETEAQLQRLKDQLAQVEAGSLEQSVNGLSVSESPVTEDRKWPLSAEEYKRYGRQMIVHSIGIQGNSYLLLGWIMPNTPRSTPSQECFSSDYRSWRFGMSSSSLYSWSRTGNHWNHGWRYC
jgi:hypothetical protein